MACNDNENGSAFGFRSGDECFQPEMIDCPGRFCCKEGIGSRCCMGPVGPRGLTGATGAEGERGATGATGADGAQSFLRGISAQLKTGVFVNSGSAVMFDTVVNNSTSSVSYVPGSGSFVISVQGNYLVMWSVNTDQSGRGLISFGINLGNVTAASVDAYADMAQITGFTMITVGTVPITLSLINNSGKPVRYNCGTSIRAGIVILQVS